MVLFVSHLEECCRIISTPLLTSLAFYAILKLRHKFLAIRRGLNEKNNCHISGAYVVNLALLL